MIDPYVHKNSLIHKLNPRVKLPLTLGFIVTISLLGQKAYPVYLLLLSIIISVTILAEIGFKHFLQRSLLVSPFLLAALPLPFISGEPYTTFVFYSYSIPISLPGMERFLAVIIKSILSVQFAILLVSTTNFPNLMSAMRHLHVPRILVLMYGMMWRYLFVILDEAKTIIQARNSRSGSVPSANFHTGGTLVWRAKVAGNMVGSLMLRSLERSERIYHAMLSRGYDGEPRFTNQEDGFAKKDTMLLVSGFCFMLLFLLMDLLL